MDVVAEFKSLLVSEHPQVRRRDLSEFYRIGEGPVDDGAPIDSREEGAIHGLLSATTVGASGLSIGLGRLAPGEYHIRHHHPNGSEFYYGLEGSGLVYLDGKVVRIEPGIAVYIPPNCVHALLNDSPEHLETMWGIDSGEYRDIGLIYDE